MIEMTIKKKESLDENQPEASINQEHQTINKKMMTGKSDYCFLTF